MKFLYGLKNIIAVRPPAFSVISLSFQVCFPHSVSFIPDYVTGNILIATTFAGLNYKNDDV